MYPSFCIIKLEIINDNFSSFLLCYYVQNGTEKKANYSDEILFGKLENYD